MRTLLIAAAALTAAITPALANMVNPYDHASFQVGQGAQPNEPAFYAAEVHHLMGNHEVVLLEAGETIGAVYQYRVTPDGVCFAPDAGAHAYLVYPKGRSLKVGDRIQVRLLGNNHECAE